MALGDHQCIDTFADNRFATAIVVDEDDSPETKFFGGITALGRMGRPSDVVNMAKFLASDEANFITGGKFTVDGGLTAGLSNSIVGSLWEDLKTL
jgi:NAD(P)-dependent dehydrogenase (short-subunit alcohol dehydrogenase family)